MTAADRLVRVRSGAIEPEGSWVYVWIDVGSGEVAYVGATGFDPEARVYAHLTSEDPAVGRVRATVRGASERDFDVLAFAISPHADRQEVKRNLVAALSNAEEPFGEDARRAYDAIQAYRTPRSDI